MNKLFFVFLLGASSMFAYSVSDNGVYSNTNNYNINQSNSNNTHIDNSKFFSNNEFTLFGVSGRDYSRYMGYESILYVSAYVIPLTSQKAAGLQLGVYEEIYLLVEYGNSSLTSNSSFINYGLSWHLDIHNDFIFSIDLVESKNFNELADKETTIMFNLMFFRANRHFGIEFGANTNEAVKVGLKGRFF